MTIKVNITVVTVSELGAHVVSPRAYKFKFTGNHERIRQYIFEDGIDADTIKTKLPVILEHYTVGNSAMSLASLNWLREVVIIEIPDLYTRALGYIQDGKIKISYVTIKDRHYYVHPGKNSYHDIFKTNEPYLGYRVDPNGLFDAIDAFPFLNDYNIIDPRFCLTSTHLITDASNNIPDAYLENVLSRLSHVRDNLSVPWHTSAPQESFRMDDIGTINMLIGNGSPDWSRLRMEVELTTTESDRIRPADLHNCLIGFRSPLVTYDYDLWYHNLSELNDLGEFLMK